MSESEHALRFAPSAIPSQETGVLVIDLGALRRNYRALRTLAAPAETAAVVKANAYGAGARHVVPALYDEGCRTFFVASLDEARVVREASPDAVVYVLGGLFPGSAGAFRDLSARPVLNSLAEIDEWAAFCRANQERLPAAVHIDTGMTRLGLAADAVHALLAQAEILQAFELSLVMSHLACGDEADNRKNAEQLALFSALTETFPRAPRSLANSAGIFLGQPYHFDLVRPGIALYGGRPQTQGQNPMEPVVWLYGRIAQVRWAEPGDTVGYGAGHRLTRRTRLVTVSVGYADGYMRAVSASGARAGAFAMAGGFKLPMLGRVSMDLITFDGTDAPEGQLQRGGFVELLGRDMTADDLAALAGTIGYEILTSLGPRYHRLVQEG